MYDGRVGRSLNARRRNELHCHIVLSAAIPCQPLRDRVCTIGATPRLTFSYAKGSRDTANTKCSTGPFTGPTVLYSSLALFALEESVLVETGLKAWSGSNLTTSLGFSLNALIARRRSFRMVS